MYNRRDYIDTPEPALEPPEEQDSGLDKCAFCDHVFEDGETYGRYKCGFICADCLTDEFMAMSDAEKIEALCDESYCAEPEMYNMFSEYRGEKVV